MAIKKIVFKNLSSSLSYLAIGGIRFYDKNNIMIPSGAPVIQGALFGEFDNFLIESNLTPYSNLYYPSYAFDTAKPQKGATGGGVDNFYWLTGTTTGGLLSCTFKTPVNTISKIEFAPLVSTSSDRGVTSNFYIDVYNEDEILICSYPITPIQVNDTVQILNTPEIEKTVIYLVKTNNKINTIIGKNKYSNNLIPAMTSNILPNGIATASSIYSTTYEPWKAFNGTLSQNDGWFSLNGATTGWLSYEFNTIVQINKYVIYPRNYSGAETHAPKSWTFEGSNDGTNWIILDTKTDITNWTLTYPKEFIFSNKQSFKKYRINVTSVNGGAYIAIGQLQMMIITEHHILGVLNNTSLSQEYFKQWGVNDLEIYSETSDKVLYEMNDGGSLDDGRVARKTVQKNELKINNLEVK